MPLFLIIFVFCILLVYWLNHDKTDKPNELETLQKYYDLIRYKGLLDVDNFNKWFNSPKPSEIYAHSGIFGRLDKLSSDHIVHYISSFGLTKSEAQHFYDDNGKTFMRFQMEIERNWSSIKNK